MPLYVVTYTHPDLEGWQRHLMPHVAWLRDQVAAGVLRASGCLDFARHKRIERRGWVSRLRST